MPLHVDVTLTTHQRLLLTMLGLQPIGDVGLPRERKELGGVSQRKEEGSKN